MQSIDTFGIIFKILKSVIDKHAKAYNKFLGNKFLFRY